MRGLGIKSWELSFLARLIDHKKNMENYKSKWMVLWCVYTSRALFANTVCKRSRIEARLV